MVQRGNLRSARFAQLPALADYYYYYYYYYKYYHYYYYYYA